MKGLLLTSNGLSNPNIVNALWRLHGSSLSGASAAFVLTGALADVGDKSWFIRNLQEIGTVRFRAVDIIDIAVPSRSLWQSRLEEADILIMGGGNTHYLMSQLERSGLAKLLPGLLEERVYVGISAGSTVASPDLSLSTSRREDRFGEVYRWSTDGLGLVPFVFRPHWKRLAGLETPCEQFVERQGTPVCGVPDGSALALPGDGHLELISGPVPDFFLRGAPASFLCRECATYNPGR